MLASAESERGYTLLSLLRAPKPQQLSSRLPKILSCKLLSSRKHSYIYKYTQEMLFFWFVFPAANGSPSSNFPLAKYKEGLLRGAENYQRRSRKQVHKLSLLLLQSFFPVSLTLGQEVAANSVYACPKAGVILVLSISKMEKTFKRLFWGEENNHTPLVGESCLPKPLISWHRAANISRHVSSLFPVVPCSKM